MPFDNGTTEAPISPDTEQAFYAYLDGEASWETFRRIRNQHTGDTA